MKVFTERNTANELELIATGLDRYRSANGTQWKSKLKELFFSGRDTESELRMFRNRFDFGTLDKIKYHTTKREIINLLYTKI